MGHEGVVCRGVSRVYSCEVEVVDKLLRLVDRVRFQREWALYSRSSRREGWCIYKQ